MNNSVFVNPNQQAQFQPRQQPVVRKRELIIDLLRGFAVAMMVITHVVAIFFARPEGAFNTYTNAQKIIHYIGEFGGIASFTTFLFLSGVALYLSFLNDDVTPEKRRSQTKKMLKKAFIFLMAYYALATVVTFVNTTLYSFPPSTVWIETFFRTIFFLLLPEFTEFLIAIIAFYALVALAPNFFRFLAKNHLVGMSLAVMFYFLGSGINFFDFGIVELNNLKALIGGHVFTDGTGGAIHSFPILQYFIILLLGIYFGKFLYNCKNTYTRLKISIIWLIGLSLLSLSSYLLYAGVGFEIFDIYKRFSVSLGFMAFSLTCTFIIFVILQIVYKAIPGSIKAALHYFGVHAFEMFFFHTAFLFAFKYLNIDAARSESITYPDLEGILVIYFLALFASWLLTSLKNYIRDRVQDEVGKDTTLWFFSSQITGSIVIVAIAGIFFFGVLKNFTSPVSADPNDYQFKKRLIREEEWPKWWNHDYQNARVVNVNNNTQGQVMYKNSWVSFVVNHSDLISSRRSYSEAANDFRVAYYNQSTGEFSELPIIIDNPNTTETRVSFKLQDNVNPGENIDLYSFYYGNEFSAEYPKSKDRFSSVPTVQGIVLSNELPQTIQVRTNNRWFLKKRELAFQSAALLFEADFSDPNLSQTSIVSYIVPGTDKSGRMQKIADGKYQAAVPVADLEPGTYRIQATVTDSADSLKFYRSFKVPFYVSYPLYVTWTMDWEGWDVDQINLDDIANIADSYQMPITHFFNPRIYIKNQYTITPITDERARYITRWVQDRQKNRFEEIGMHIHMWSDMVAEAGVTPRSQSIVGTYGVDVPSYAYTTEELETVFRWGRLKLSENGLGLPTSYRTGAWMSGTNVLQAAQNAGFLIDSSGRTSGPVNPSNPFSTPVPWNLQTNTSPYLPNKNDINSWSGSLADRMKIWEFPNNGADSYWFDAGVLISRFDANYPNKGQILYKPQVVTYLSHPHWFVQFDTWKIRGVLDYANQYLSRNDKGPVVYKNLSDIYFEWDRDEFYNGE